MKYNLERFLDAQQRCFDNAYEEIRTGYKRGCWMWYIFPQLQALGQSSTSIYYGIRDLKEAQAYLAHPILSKRLYTMTRLLLNLNTNCALEVFGYPDDMKLHSCMTLFHIASKEDKHGPFMKVIDKFFDGELDKNTIKLLK